MARTKEQLAARREARKEARRPSVAHLIKVVGDELKLDLDGLIIQGSLSALNAHLAKLGYKKVRTTSNMLNPASPTFAIDADTPSYCDPGCESYHSM